MIRFSSARVINDELGINSCGIQPITRDSHNTRERVDYSLMYLSSGSATIYINSVPHTMNSGEAILYLPGAKQNYTFHSTGGSVNKWLHFGGTLCSCLDGNDSRIIKIFSRHEFESNLDRLVHAFNRIDNDKDMLCDGYLRVIIALLLESEKRQNDNPNAIQTRIDRVTEYIHSHVNQNININHLAEMCFVSRNRFNHIFKEYMGCSPLSYQRLAQIEWAKRYLRDLGMSVSECAEALGFSDVNYFCRLFKKHTGYKPSEYKKL